MNESTANTRSKIFFIASMSIFGTIGLFRRYIDLGSGTLAMLRGLIGAAFLFFFLLFTKKGIDKGAVKKNLLKLIVSGILIGFNWILLFEAYNYTTVATATLCYYMEPVIVICVSPFFFKEKITLKKAICVAVALCGMALVSGIFSTSFNGAKDLKGILLGLGAALLYSTVVIINKCLGVIDAYSKTSIQLASAGIVLIPYVLLMEDVNSIKLTPMLVIMVLLVGLLHTGTAYAMYFGSISQIKAQTVALLSYIDPIVAVILSATVLHEHMSLSGWIGAVLVIASMIVSEL